MVTRLGLTRVEPRDLVVGPAPLVVSISPLRSRRTPSSRARPSCASKPTIAFSWWCSRAVASSMASWSARPSPRRRHTKSQVRKSVALGIDPGAHFLDLALRGQDPASVRRPPPTTTCPPRTSSPSSVATSRPWRVRCSRPCPTSRRHSRGQSRRARRSASGPLTRQDRRPPPRPAAWHRRHRGIWPSTTKPHATGLLLAQQVHAGSGVRGWARRRAATRRRADARARGRRHAAAPRTAGRPVRLRGAR